MGGGGGSSKTTKNTTTNTTSTTTSVGDIGFTGDAAIALATVIQQGGLESERLQLNSLDNLIQGAGTAYQQLIGGAGKLVETSAQQTNAALSAATLLAGKGALPESEKSGFKLEGTTTIIAAAAALLTIVALRN